jgi:hypothetical protein
MIAGTISGDYALAGRGTVRQSGMRLWVILRLTG